MKIAYLSQGDSPHTLKWINQLSKYGVEIHLITQNRLIDGISNRVKTHTLPFKGTKGYFLNVFALRKLLQEISPDILHSNFASGYGTLATLSNFKPRILSVWGNDIFQFPHKSLLKKNLLKLNLSTSNIITSTSEAMLKQTCLYTSKHVEHIPFGIDTDFYQPIPPKKDTKSFVVGIAKHLHIQYGHFDLFNGFQIFLKGLTASEQTKCFLKIAGDGPFKEMYQTTISELNLTDKVSFVGHVAQNGMPEFLNSLDVLVNPSHYESFGVAILEASSCGLPVIGTRVGGIPEVIEEGRTGLIVEPKKPEQIAEMLNRLYRSQEMRLEMGKNGRNYVIEKYQIDQCTKRLLRTYESLILSKAVENKFYSHIL